MGWSSAQAQHNNLQGWSQAPDAAVATCGAGVGGRSVGVGRRVFVLQERRNGSNRREDVDRRLVEETQGTDSRHTEEEESFSGCWRPPGGPGAERVARAIVRRRRAWVPGSCSHGAGSHHRLRICRLERLARRRGVGLLVGRRPPLDGGTSGGFVGGQRVLRLGKGHRVRHRGQHVLRGHLVQQAAATQGTDDLHRRRGRGEHAGRRAGTGRPGGGGLPHGSPSCVSGIGAAGAGGRGARLCRCNGAADGEATRRRSACSPATGGGWAASGAAGRPCARPASRPPRPGLRPPPLH